jgi:hypothetical protein
MQPIAQISLSYPYDSCLHTSGLNYSLQVPHIAVSSNHCIGELHATQQLGSAEVSNFERISPRDEDISRFQVTMQDFVAV